MNGMDSQQMVWMFRIHMLMFGTELLTFATAVLLFVRQMANRRHLSETLKRIEQNGNGKNGH